MSIQPSLPMFLQDNILYYSYRSVSTVVSLQLSLLVFLSKKWISTIIFTCISKKWISTIVSTHIFVEYISTMSLQRYLHGHIYTILTWNISTTYILIYNLFYTSKTWIINILVTTTCIKEKNAANKKEKALRRQKAANIRRTENTIKDKSFEFLDQECSNDTDSSSSDCNCDLHHDCPKHRWEHWSQRTFSYDKTYNYDRVDPVETYMLDGQDHWYFDTYPEC